MTTIPSPTPAVVRRDAAAQATARAQARDMEDYGPLPLGQRIVNLIFILVPLCAFVWAVVYAWGTGVGWTELALMTGLYLVTGFGVTIGYHRLFTHKSFRTGPIMTTIFGILGSMSSQGPIISWVAHHRCHHQHSDHEHDPHSPHGHGSGFMGIVKGFFMSHVGWMILGGRRDLKKYVPDLEADPLVRTLSRTFLVWMALSLLLPAAIGGLISMTWWGAFLGFVWGGLIRIALVHHITWSVNSVCHIWGSRSYDSHDESRNNPIVGVLALGEGWHNNHHAFPTSARHGLKWWQFDSSYLIIKALEKLGLVWDVKVPSAERMAQKALTRSA
ncbi:MAG: fatty acid desaturase [Phycisphaeraceae bacterium]|nr:fatty acid desaturase [Phycisphaeraceae bacterium]